MIKIPGLRLLVLIAGKSKGLNLSPEFLYSHVPNLRACVAPPKAAQKSATTSLCKIILKKLERIRWPVSRLFSCVQQFHSLCSRLS